MSSQIISRSRLRTPVLDSRVPNPEYEYGWASGGAICWGSALLNIQRQTLNNIYLLSFSSFLAIIRHSSAASAQIFILRVHHFMVQTI
jgi:hypothetical protein